VLFGSLSERWKVIGNRYVSVVASAFLTFSSQSVRHLATSVHADKEFRAAEISSPENSFVDSTTTRLVHIFPYTLFSLSLCLAEEIDFFSPLANLFFCLIGKGSD
jgi:hypothetical protein